MKKDSALRIRLDNDLHQQFLTVCRSLDKPAAQVIREFMRSYVEMNQNLLEDSDGETPKLSQR